MSVEQVIEYHSKQLLSILQDELEVEKAGLEKKFHFKILERIFIEKGIYKLIENMETEESVNKAVMNHFEKEILHPISFEDIKYLLLIPIQRI